MDGDIIEQGYYEVVEDDDDSVVHVDLERTLYVQFGGEVSLFEDLCSKEATIGESLKMEDDWDPTGNLLDGKTQVVIHDRLMSDAVLIGTDVPIKTEHSYCTRMFNSDNEDDASASTITLHKIQDDIIDECYATSSSKSSSMNLTRHTDSPTSIRLPVIVVKDEPISETESLSSSCPSSPGPPPPKFRIRSLEKKGKIGKEAVGGSQANRLAVPRIKMEPNNTGITPPPTPPSSASSDSEVGNISPSRTSVVVDRKILLPPSSVIIQPTRQPIQTPLISCQPKGSTGTLHLTEEEKRTLMAEGYPVPTKLPLTKMEEKSLKKIRRKIKNKISAQESRRKKKEYMDSLEKRVDYLESVCNEQKKKVASLTSLNNSLDKKLKELQRVREHLEARILLAQCVGLEE